MPHKRVGLLDSHRKLPEKIVALGQCEEFCVSLFLPKRLKIKSMELKHEDGEGHGCKTFTLDFHPIRDLVVIKTVQNFRNLHICSDILLIEVFMGSLFEFMHDFN